MVSAMNQKLRKSYSSPHSFTEQRRFKDGFESSTLKIGEVFNAKIISSWWTSYRAALSFDSLITFQILFKWIVKQRNAKSSVKEHSSSRIRLVEKIFHPSKNFLSIFRTIRAANEKEPFLKHDQHNQEASGLKVYLNCHKTGNILDANDLGWHPWKISSAFHRIHPLVKLSILSEVHRRFVRQICPPQSKVFVALSLLKDRHSKLFFIRL